MRSSRRRKMGAPRTRIWISTAPDARRRRKDARQYGPPKRDAGEASPGDRRPRATATAVTGSPQQLGGVLDDQPPGDAVLLDDVVQVEHLGAHVVREGIHVLLDRTDHALRVHALLQSADRCLDVVQA